MYLADYHTSLQNGRIYPAGRNTFQLSECVLDGPAMQIYVDVRSKPKNKVTFSIYRAFSWRVVSAAFHF